MLDLLLSIDMGHFSGRGRGQHRGCGSTWECVCEREILLTVFVRKNMHKCESVFKCVLVFLPVSCPVEGVKA